MTALRLTPAQYDMLLQELPPYRVRQLRGQSHLEAWDVRRTLTRIFGFGGWDLQTKDLALVREIEHAPTTDGGKPRWTVVYRAEVCLFIKNPDGTVGAFFEDAAAGDSQNQPSIGDAHDQAMKTALSQGLKRCAVNLGDQFGMSLYNNGRTKAVVTRTLVAPADSGHAVADPPVMPHDETPVQGEPEPQTQHEEWESAVPAKPATGKNPGNDPQRRRMYALLGKAELSDREAKLAYVVDVIGRAVASSNDLTDAEVATVCDRLEAYIKQTEPTEVPT